MFGLSITKRYVWIYVKTAGSASFSTKSDIAKILSEHLKLHNDLAKQLVESKTLLLKLPRSQIIQNCALLQKWNVNVTSNDHITTCMRVHPETLKHRIHMMEEMGIKNLSLSDIGRLKVNMRKTVDKFKEAYHIPQSKDIAVSMFSSVNIPAKNIPNFLISKGISTHEYYQLYLRYFVEHCLKLDPARLLQADDIAYQSFRMLLQIVQFLTEEVKIERDFIMKYPKLLDMCLDNARLVIAEFKDLKIGDANLMKIIEKYPYFLNANVDNTKQLLKSFEEYNIKDEWIWSHLSIFRVPHDVFLDRYNRIKTNPDLSIWLRHPRVLYLVSHLKVVGYRIKDLYLLDRMKYSNIHTITSRKKFFDRNIRNGSGQTAYRKFLEYVISKELGKDKEYLVSDIMKHPYCKMVGLYGIEKILQYLKEHYTIDEICQSIHIILYPQPLVAETLASLREHYSSENGYKFTPVQYLALCVYTLEKNNHFSGDAIWGNIQETGKKTSPSVDGNDDNSKVIDENTNAKFFDDLNDPTASSKYY